MWGPGAGWVGWFMKELQGIYMPPETMQRIVYVTILWRAIKGVQASIWECLGDEGEDSEDWTDSQRGVWPHKGEQSMV